MASAAVTAGAGASVRRGDPPKALMLKLRDAFGIDYFLETGTYRGRTTTWAAQHFRQVVTIEASEDLYTAAVAAHRHLKNVRFVLGDTRAVLSAEVARLGSPAVVWLDSHWSGGTTYGKGHECPLLSEIETLRGARHQHFLFIDDARLFMAPPPRPHDMDQWPGLVQVTEALTRGRQPLETLILGDAFVAVPARARQLVRAFAQDAVTRTWQETSTPLGGRLLDRAGRLRTRVGSALGRLGVGG